MLGGLISDWSLGEGNWLYFVCFVINVSIISFKIWLDHKKK